MNELPTLNKLALFTYQSLILLFSTLTHRVPNPPQFDTELPSLTFPISDPHFAVAAITGIVPKDKALEGKKEGLKRREVEKQEVERGRHLRLLVYL